MMDAYYSGNGALAGSATLTDVAARMDIGHTGTIFIPTFADRVSTPPP